MKIYYTEEIFKCFLNQYPDKKVNYDILLSCDYPFPNVIKIYDDMIETMEFMIKLIRTLEVKND